MTGNRGKFEEAALALSKHGFEVRMEDLDVDEPQADTLDYVSRRSVLSAFELLKAPLFVEDAGLFIHSLRGFPGVYSSYVFSTIGIDGVLKLMEGERDRRAEFRSVVAFTSQAIHPDVLLFEGRVEGEIASSPKGSGGFGFDPIFMPKGSALTYAQVGLDEKNRNSHRARALHSMGSYLSSHLGLVK